MTSSRNQDNGWKRLTRGAPLAVMVAAAIFLIYKLVPVLELVAVAVLLAIALRTLLEWLQKVVRVRWLAVLILIAMIVGFGMFLFLVVIPGFVQQAQILLSALPNYLNSLTQTSQRLHAQVSFIPDVSQELTQLRSLLYGIVGSFPTLLQELFSITVESIATLILALYIAYDPHAIIQGLLQLTPRKQHKRIAKLIQATEVRLRGWLFGTAIAVLLVGGGAVIGLWILGVPLFLSFGVIAGLLEIIPYFGSIVGTFLPALVALSISPLKAILVLGLFLVLNQVDAHLIQPIVMSQRVRLHPVTVILSFLVMGQLLGFIGVLLAVPAAAVLVTLIDELTSAPVPAESTGDFKAQQE